MGKIISVLIFFIFVTTVLKTQNVKKVTVKLNEYTKEVYYVLESDKNIKHGKYQLFKYDNLATEGYYKNNQKDSIWKNWTANKKVIKEYNYKQDLLNGLSREYNYYGLLNNKGNYIDNKKFGEWEYYDFSGDITKKGLYLDDMETGEWEFYKKGSREQRYDYTSKKILFDAYESTNKNVLVPGVADGVFDTLDYGAFFIGGQYLLFNFINTNINYPLVARENGIAGTVYTNFIVDETGNIMDLKILRGIGGGCNEEAFRVIQLTSGKWSPAINNGKVVQMKYTIPVKYQLE